jgi:hypothetical protein
MAGDSSSSKVQTFATIVTTVLAVAAFIQGLSNRQQGASTQSASRKSYGAVGGQLAQLGTTSEQQSAAIEKLWEAVSEIQGRQAGASAPVATAPTAPAAAPHHAHATHRAPATAEVVPPAPAAGPPAPTPAAAEPVKPVAASGVRALGPLQLQRFTERKLPAYEELEK